MATNDIRPVSAPDVSDGVVLGGVLVPAKFAVIAASASGGTDLVAAVTGKKIRVLRWYLSANGAVNVKFQSKTSPTPADITGLIYLTQFKDSAGGYSPVGHFETIAGEALTINLSAAVAVGGCLVYIEA